MEQPDEGRLPEELEAVAARLRAARAQADPLQLDEIKQRAMRSPGQRPGSMLMKQRLATFATIFALVGGTGGAVALAGGGDHGNGNGAAHGQYCEGHEKGKGRDHAKHDDCGQGDDDHGKGGDHHGQGGDQGKGGDHQTTDAKSRKK